MTSYAFSCVVDNVPALMAQAFIWVNCLKRLQSIEPSDIYVHLVDVQNREFLDWLEAEQVNVVAVERFDQRSPHCNKIQQLHTFAGTDYDQIVLMDCDTAWVGSGKLPIGAPISACIVDAANPPERILLNIFNASGLGAPKWARVGFPMGSGHEFTDANNCNGGLYICDQEFVPKLARFWRFWALWCLDRSELLEAFTVHADQISFALAMREMGASVHHLPIAWNYPTHFPADLLPDISPEIIHYHDRLDAHLKLKEIGKPRVDRSIADMNSRISEFISENMLNSVYWDHRYRCDPVLGSGIGSRGEALTKKRELISRALASFEGKHVIDVGCGDLETTRHLDLQRYYGVDLSEEAIKIAKTKRPEWRFDVLPPEEALPKGDVVLCLDVLIHQPTEAAFLSLIERLTKATQSRLIVSGYEAAPSFTSEITRYYLPITEALRRNGAFSRIQVLGGYRDVVVVVADKAQSDPGLVQLKRHPGTKLGKIVVGSGWWCDERPHDWALGSPATRSVEFFELWYRQVVRCLEPDRIVVTDSASPIKPDNRSRPLLTWIELDRNYGHANDIRTGRIRTKYSGFTRSVINGAMYALCCDADFYIYVEQDCLLHGESFLEYAIGDSAADILVGPPPENGRGLSGSTVAPMLQQSLMIVRRSGLERFLTGLLSAPASDGDAPPEETMRTGLAPIDFLRVPFGRSRPIDFDLAHFYAQHLDDDELAQFLNKLGVAPPSSMAVNHPISGAASDQNKKHTNQSALSGDRFQPTDIPEELQQELQQWVLAGKKACFWWRDDDAVSDTPALRRLLYLAKELGTVVALAVIPERADGALARLLTGAPACVWQHGWRHHWQLNEEDNYYTQGEFGEGRKPESMMADAHQGQLALDRIFGESGWQRVFVPPFHALSVPFKMLLPSLGYRGLSAGLPLTLAVDTVLEMNAEVDIINWPKRTFHGSDDVARVLIEQLQSRRHGQRPEDAPIGLLTHHLAMNEEAWEFVTSLFSFLKTHAGAELVPANLIFEAPNATQLRSPFRTNLGSAGEKGSGEVTVVVTSCGRQDLLEITLDSFSQYNTSPIQRFIVIEDGDGAENRPLMEKYRHLPFTWLATGHRVGQIASIDMAYRSVATEFIFHCEDDWEFTAPGFIEKSLAILNCNHSVLQVWIRALDDANHHPFIDYALEAGGISYRLLRHHHDAGKWGTWHGFSWNPGLRRLRDYRLIGSFGSLDPETTKETWQVESEASAVYQARGFFAAILADNNGNGYVRHIGGGRRVARDYLMSNSEFRSARLERPESPTYNNNFPEPEIDVRRNRGIGDVLMCTPVLRELKHRRPSCRIRFYTDYPSLLRGLPYIDEVHPTEAAPANAIDLEYEPRVPPSPDLHLSKIMGAILDAEPRDVRPDCAIDPAMVGHFRLAWAGLPRPHIVLNRSASSWTPNKAWPDKYWTELIRRLSQTATVIEIGVSSEISANSYSGGYIDLRGCTTLEELVGATAASDLHVGPISGPSHIAAATGKRSVLIIGGYEGPSNAAYPFDVGFYSPVACAPCWLDTACPHALKCLEAISPDQVERAVWALWDEIRSTALPMQSDGIAVLSEAIYQRARSAHAAEIAASLRQLDGEAAAKAASPDYLVPKRTAGTLFASLGAEQTGTSVSSMLGRITDFASGRPEAGVIPKRLTRPSVEYNLTEHCNLACYGCDHASPLLPTKFASVAEFSRDLAALARVFHSENLSIVGGEPLLHPQLIDFLLEARRIDIADYVVFYTNGVLLHKAPDRFWELIDVLKISAYPGVTRRLDDEACAKICSRYNIDLKIFDKTEFEVTLINNHINDTDLVKDIYRDCKSCREWSCHTVYDGRFYKCSAAPFTGARLGLKGIAFDNLASDGIALHDNPNLYEELERYLNDPLPLAACSYCLGSSGPSVPHRQLNRKGRQQWLEEDNSADIEAAWRRLNPNRKRLD